MTITRRFTQAATALGLAVALALGSAAVAPPALAHTSYWCGHSGSHSYYASSTAITLTTLRFGSHRSYYSGSTLVHEHTNNKYNASGAYTGRSISYC